MNRKLEVLLTILALAGLYSAVPKASSRPLDAGVSAQQVVIVAEGDGSDPMPLCRKGICNQ
jgi:hypothetical protein